MDGPALRPHRPVEGAVVQFTWLLPTIPDDDVQAALLNYRIVTDVVKERWKVSGVSDKASRTRTVIMNLKAGVKPEDIPHQIRIAGELALVVVPGRAPLCLRCQCTGHNRRSGLSDNSELLMDASDSEAAARAEAESSTTDSAPAEQISGERVSAGPTNFKGEDALTVTDEASEVALSRRATTKNSPPASADVAAKADYPRTPEADGVDTIDAATSATGCVAESLGIPGLGFGPHGNLSSRRRRATTKSSPPASGNVAAKADHPTRPEADGVDTIDAATTATGYIVTEPSEKNVGRKDDDAAAPAYDTKEIADADTDTNKTSTTASN
ncbi:hypothetical protein HPB52_004684 [Rhipicephalus sanguineus]|uniref:Uncharacterized protein n=1 Tax=Rhipicephalus sanguineus TaxID=34632 RepID=A0A9D4T7J8_RHISA|nr:hypothetical protein HPB52_004684 [Rhipicephalus sanguineus]